MYIYIYIYIERERERERERQREREVAYLPRLTTSSINIKIDTYKKKLNENGKVKKEGN